MRRTNVIRSFDAFSRPVDELRSTSAVGGIITVIAYLSAGVLLIAQIVLYIKLDTRQDLFMADNLANPFMVKSNYVAIVSDRSNHGAKTNHRLETLWQLRQKLLIKFHITFPHIRCGELEVAHDDLSGDDFVKAYGKSVYTTRLPSRAEREKLRMHLEGGITREGCTIEGTLPVPKVGGMMSITVTKESWNRVANALSSLSMGLFTPQMEIGSIVKNLPNVSHYIHNVQFGEQFPLSINPLQDTRHVVENNSGLGIANVVVKLVPTKYKRFARRPVDMYQVSVTDHMVLPNAAALARSPLLPGLVLSYDFTPLSIHHTEYRESFLSFLSSLVSIVGGTFVTVGLVSRFLVNAASIAKKND